MGDSYDKQLQYGEITNQSDIKTFVDELVTKWNRNKNVHHESLMEMLKLMVEKLEYLDSSLSDYCKSLLYDKIQLEDIHITVISNNKEKLADWLSCEDNIEEIDTDTRFGETCLYFSSYYKQSGTMIELLKAGARITKSAEAVDSELFAAVRSRNLAGAATLISWGSNVNVICEGWTVLHIACFNKDTAMIRLLLNNGANINTIGAFEQMAVNTLFIELNKDNYMITPCLLNNEKCILSGLAAFLMYKNDQHVELNHSSTENRIIGNPPIIQRALVMLSPAILRLLLNHGAQATCLFAGALRGLHDEAVMLAINDKRYGYSLDERVERYRFCIELLVHHGIEPQTLGWRNTIRVLIRQMEKIPLTRKKPHMEPVFKYLIKIASTPPTLQTLCRRVVRRYIGHPISERLSNSQINTPKSIYQFILLA